MRFSVASLIILLVTSVFAAPTPLVPIQRTLKGRALPSQYIVKLKPKAVAQERRTQWLKNTLKKSNATMLPGSWETLKMGWHSHIYDGFSGQFGTEALAALRASGDVQYITEDAEAWLTAVTTQTNAPWSLNRLSQQAPLGSSNAQSLAYPYRYDESAGTGVDVYIVDTGVRVTHQEFQGRARFGATFGPGVPGQDIHGHGTHCAGIAASRQFGVAKAANIIAVKVMSDEGRGETSDIISGISFAVNEALASGRPSVISISIIAPSSEALNDVVQSAVSKGVHVIVGAGNDNKDASGFSPAGSEDALTVGASDINDLKASFSNFGTVVDIFAPGVDITSTFATSDTAVKVLSGTSMATPLISGTVAYLLSLNKAIGSNSTITPPEMKNILVKMGDKGIISGLPNGTPNILVFNGVANSQSAPLVTPATPDGIKVAPPGSPENALAQQQVLAGFMGALRIMFPKAKQ